MNRFFALLAVAALTLTAVIPAAAFAEPDRFAAELSPSAVLHHDAMMQSPQFVLAHQTPSAPVLRDEFAVEILKPEPVVPVPPLAPVSFTSPSGLLAVWPCSAQVNDGYGPRDGGFHFGMDIMCSWGTPLVAAAAGVVEVVEDGAGGWGQFVTINHGEGVSTLYSHMVSGSPTVVVGQAVSAGEVIGLTGDTGNTTAPHLHFEVWVHGARVDPRPWLP